MKKIFIAALLALSLAACGNTSTAVSGELTTFSAKNYTIQLPSECTTVSSELSDISAQYGGCSVAVVSMPSSQATVCSDKEKFSKAMESLGYDLEVTDYSKEKAGGLDAYTADYRLGKANITQITYINGDTAYVATYARPADTDKETDKIFIKGMKAFKLEEQK